MYIDNAKKAKGEEKLKKILININDYQNQKLKEIQKDWGVPKSFIIRTAINELLRRIDYQNQKYNPLDYMSRKDYEELIRIAKTKWIEEE